jgi:hypothetical protein
VFFYSPLSLSINPELQKQIGAKFLSGNLKVSKNEIKRGKDSLSSPIPCYIALNRKSPAFTGLFLQTEASIHGGALLVFI